jgi:hypothetical protein
MLEDLTVRAGIVSTLASAIGMLVGTAGYGNVTGTGAIEAFQEAVAEFRRVQAALKATGQEG